MYVHVYMYKHPQMIVYPNKKCNLYIYTFTS